MRKWPVKAYSPIATGADTIDAVTAVADAIVAAIVAVATAGAATTIARGVWRLEFMNKIN